VKLEIVGDYPVKEQVEIKVTPARVEEFTLSLRIPAWSERTELKVNGKEMPASPGYAKIRRKWRKGDRVSVAFDMRARRVESNGQIAFQRGPIVLSLDNRLTPGAAGQVTLAPNLELKLNTAAAKRIGAWLAFDVGTLTFCDYASAGNGFSEQNIFRTWLPQPLDMSKVYETGQTWRTLSHAPAWTNPPKPRPRVENPKGDIALAANGATANSDGEYAREL